MINKFDPDVLTGYNTDNFDFPYLISRAKLLGAEFKFSRVKGFECKAVEKVF